MKIGLLSDTHSYLDPTLATHFKDCDEIWHAGDIGDPLVTQTLAKLKPLRAVYGNIDEPSLRLIYLEDCWFTCEELKIWMTHIGGTPPSYNPRIRKRLQQEVPDVFICGHSHILKVKKDEKLGTLFINPGAAGQQGFHVMRTAMRLEIADGKIGKLEVIELGKRGK